MLGCRPLQRKSGIRERLQTCRDCQTFTSGAWFSITAQIRRTMAEPTEFIRMAVPRMCVSVRELRKEAYDICDDCNPPSSLWRCTGANVYRRTCRHAPHRHAPVPSLLWTAIGYRHLAVPGDSANPLTRTASLHETLRNQRP